MITAVLETKDNIVVGKCSMAGNEELLIRHEPTFPKMSSLSEIDYDVFTKSDMDELIKELKALQQIVSEQEQQHIVEILQMTVRCRDEDGLTLTFTPFE